MGAFVKREIRNPIVAAFALAASLASAAQAADKIIAATGGAQDTWYVHQSVDARGVATCYVSTLDSPVTIEDGYYKYVVPPGAVDVEVMGSVFGGFHLAVPLTPKPPRIMSDSVRFAIEDVKGAQWVRVAALDKSKARIGIQGVMHSTPGSEAAIAAAAAACPATWRSTSAPIRTPYGQISPQITSALSAIPSAASPKAPAPTVASGPTTPPIAPAPPVAPTPQAVGALCPGALVVRLRAYPLPELGIAQLCNAPAQAMTPQGVGSLCSAMLAERMRQYPLPETGIAQLCK